MEITKLITLSTAHLHPLEAEKIDKFAYVANCEQALVNTSPEMRDFYYQGGLVCLCDLLKVMQEKYDAGYVLFDPDANTTDELKLYNW